jgi:transitional endoplasmic reticulum ATPase
METSERQAWEMLYNQEQRTILDNAVSAMNRSRVHKSIDEQETTVLRKATYQRKKDFAEIKKMTEALEEKIRE